MTADLYQKNLTFSNGTGYASGLNLNGFPATAVDIYNARSINISKVANGYKVEIGCQTFVFESMISMLRRIEEYYNDPGAVEKHFLEFKKLP